MSGLDNRFDWPNFVKWLVDTGYAKLDLNIGMVRPPRRSTVLLFCKVREMDVGPALSSIGWGLWSKPFPGKSFSSAVPWVEATVSKKPHLLRIRKNKQNHWEWPRTCQVLKHEHAQTESEWSIDKSSLNNQTDPLRNMMHVVFRHGSLSRHFVFILFWSDSLEELIQIWSGSNQFLLVNLYPAFFLFSLVRSPFVDLNVYSRWIEALLFGGRRCCGAVWTEMGQRWRCTNWGWLQTM